VTSVRVSVPADADTARAYAQAKRKDRRKVRLLLGLQLRQLVAGDGPSLARIMDSVGAQAAANGLTEEELGRLLRDA